jgi:hypothetical protein
MAKSAIERFICMKVREKYAELVAKGKDLYAELLKELIPDCFGGEQ